MCIQREHARAREREKERKKERRNQTCRLKKRSRDIKKKTQATSSKSQLFSAHGETNKGHKGGKGGSPEKKNDLIFFKKIILKMTAREDLQQKNRLP